MNKNLLSWLLYDAGNSFVISATGSLFLAQWLVLEKGLPEAWYGAAFSLATIFVLLTSPILGAWSDKLGRRKNFVNFFTLVIMISGLLIIFTTNIKSPSNFFPVFTLFLFFIIQYAYQLSLVFFNSLLEKLSSEKTRAKISGLSMLYNQTAFVLANAILLPFSLGILTLIGNPGRSQVFLPAFVIFTVLSLPFLLKFKETERRYVPTAKKTSVFKNTIEGIKFLYQKERNVGIFLLGFSFVSDALLTIGLYFALIMNELYKISDVKKFIVVSTMFIFAALGGVLGGKFANKIGIKKMVLGMATSIGVAFSIAFVASKFWILIVVIIFAGLGWGGFYTLTRALLVKIAPKEQLGEYFGFYSTFERFASIIGPTIWGIIITILASNSLLKYKVAGFSQIFLMIIGIYILTKVKEKRTVTRT